MLIRAINSADVTVRPMAFQADLLFRPRLGRDVDGSIKIAEHGVVQLLHTVELRLEVSRRARTNMAIDARNLRVRGVLGRNKLRLHGHMAALTTKVNRLGILICLVAAKRRQKKKANDAERK